MNSKMVILFYGDNGIHEFWEGETLLILRNHPEQYWTAMKKEAKGHKVIGDDKKNAKSKAGTWYCLSAKSSGELAKMIEIQEGITIEFEYAKRYQGKERMKLVEKKPIKKAITESKKR